MTVRARPAVSEHGTPTVHQDGTVSYRDPNTLGWHRVDVTALPMSVLDTMTRPQVSRVNNLLARLASIGTAPAKD